MLETNFNTCVRLLLSEGVDTDLRIIVHVLALWMENYFSENSENISKDEMINYFEQRVDQVLMSSVFQREEYPFDWIVPNFSWERVDEISRKILLFLDNKTPFDAMAFLGEITGRWILMCPRAIIVRAGGTGDEKNIVFTMRKWLDRAIH